MGRLIVPKRYAPGALRIKSRELIDHGFGLDVLTMPDGHIGCSKCKNPYFEVWVDIPNHKVEIGCCACGWSTKLLLPASTKLSAFKTGGRFECSKHKSGIVIIKNTDVISFGCRQCVHEINLQIIDSGLILPI